MSNDSDDDFDFDSIVEETRKEAKAKSEEKGKGKGKKSEKEHKISEKELKKIASKPSQEEIARREELLLLICRYGNSARFGEYLKNLEFTFDIKKLREMDSEQLTDMLTRIEAANGHKNNVSFISTGVKLATGTIETITSKHPALREKYNCTGLTMKLEQSDDYLDALEELDIKYGTKFRVKPEYRLILAVGSSATAVIAANRQIANTVKAAEEKQEKKESDVPTPDPPASAPPSPAASEGMGLGGEPPKEEEADDAQKEALSKLGFGQ